MNEKKKGVFATLVELDHKYDETVDKAGKLATEWTTAPEQPKKRRTLRQYTKDLVKKSLHDMAPLVDPRKISKRDLNPLAGIGAFFGLLFAGFLGILIGIGSLFTIFKRKHREAKAAESAETKLDENSDEIKAWHRIKDKLKDQPIPSVQDADISDEEIKLVLPLMRKRINWAENHPDQADPYEALGSDYQDYNATIQQLADMRGIAVDDLPEE